MGIIAMKYINTANLKRKGFSLSNGVAEPQSITMDSQIQEKKSSSHLAAPCNSHHPFY
jgi:hypothetical protein